jgi:hypothetical protein
LTKGTQKSGAPYKLRIPLIYNNMVIEMDAVVYPGWIADLNQWAEKFMRRRIPAWVTAPWE